MARKVMESVLKMHRNCRIATGKLEYLPSTSVFRQPVPDDKVPWTVSWSEYDPEDYTAPIVSAGPVWADPNIRY